jgi:single-stranded-DNA-specific exonuclease
MTPVPDAPAAARLLAEAMARFDLARPVVVACHFDADGLGAGAILSRALRDAGWTVEPRIVGRGENAWSEEFGEEMRARAPGGLLVTDLGLGRQAIAPGVPTVVIDHHVPTGEGGGATVISGNGREPEPTSALLAWWAAGALGDQSDLLWLAALGLIGDMAEDKGFPEMAEAQARWGKTALRDATALVNQPRRSASGDASPALALLMRCHGPKEVLSGAHPETQALLDAKAEVQAALAQARKVAPRIQGEVALIPIDTPCQVHPLIAQQWRTRLKGKVVIAANFGYAPGWVNFAARTSGGHDLIEFFRAHRPPGADEKYGNGHRAASGGALRPDDWAWFLRSLGFPGEVAA